MRVVVSVIDKRDFSKISSTQVIDFTSVETDVSFREKNVCTIMDQSFGGVMDLLPETLGFLAYTNREGFFKREREIYFFIKDMVRVSFDGKVFYAFQKDIDAMVVSLSSGTVCSIAALASKDFDELVSSVVKLFEDLGCEDAYGDYEYDLMKGKLSDDVYAFIKGIDGGVKV